MRMTHGIGQALSINDSMPRAGWRRRTTRIGRGSSGVLPSEFRPVEEKLDALVRDSFGTVRLSNEILFTPVMDIQVGNTGLGKANILHCLFTDNTW
jgi:hypothetical protein